MCCIIHRLKNSKAIPDSNIESIIDINSHGWGISYMENTELQIVKSMEMDNAVVKIRELEKKNIEFLFHARFATHGDKNIANCHPYEINDGVLFHNGKIDIHQRSVSLSDTYYFSLKVNKFLRKNKSFEYIVKLFSKALGPSRLAFMTNSGTVLKFGTWHEEDTCFYSKLNWKWSAKSYYGYGVYNDVNYGKSDKYVFNAYKETLKCCEDGKILYKAAVSSLSEFDLIALALKFPSFCADYLIRQNPTTNANHTI